MKQTSTQAHAVQLLQGTLEFYPALIEAIATARDEVRLETYILDFNGSTQTVIEALMHAARRGVKVYLTVDGVGTGHLPADWALRFLDAGIEWRVYEPLGPLGLLRPSRWRRLHRKLVVVDRAVAFCGGINLLDDYHDPNHGPLSAPRLDFATRVSGPLVAEVFEALDTLWQRMQAAQQLRARQLQGALESLRASAARPLLPRPSTTGSASAVTATRASLLMRDNLRHRTDIESAYLRAIGRARREILIANAYFLPGRRLRRALILAAQRGVQVTLLLQGRYEYFMQYYATRPIYSAMLKAGITIYEYAPSFLHAKVAVIDQQWATVGSSNLDPLSLLLAREANVLIEDRQFAAALHARLQDSIRREGIAVDPAQFARRSSSERMREWLALVLMRVGLFISGKRY